MNKHTPGPWTEYDGSIEHDGVAIAMVYGADDFPCLDEDEGVQQAAIECKANAELIAAAPDMYSLLSWVSDCWPKRDENWYRPDMEDCVDAIRAFLAARPAPPTEDA